jgi:16S rRNA C1402 (ribose-2'-O) methylase RsmI
VLSVEANEAGETEALVKLACHAKEPEIRVAAAQTLGAFVRLAFVLENVGALAEDSDPASVLPAPVLERIRALDAFVVENAKSARRFLAACGHPRPMREVAMSELNEHTPAAAVAALLEPALAGADLGLLSEAGVPAVADPGAALVAEAHAHGVAVVPCVGPSSILLALMASGLEGQRFRFAGYLPADAAITPRDHNVTRAELRSPVVWNGTSTSSTKPEDTRPIRIRRSGGTSQKIRGRRAA